MKNVRITKCDEIRDTLKNNPKASLLIAFSKRPSSEKRLLNTVGFDPQDYNVFNIMSVHKAPVDEDKDEKLIPFSIVAFAPNMMVTSFQKKHGSISCRQGLEEMDDFDRVIIFANVKKEQMEQRTFNISEARHEVIEGKDVVFLLAGDPLMPMDNHIISAQLYVDFG